MNATRFLSLGSPIRRVNRQGRFAIWANMTENQTAYEPQSFRGVSVMDMPDGTAGAHAPPTIETDAKPFARSEALDSPYAAIAASGGRLAVRRLLNADDLTAVSEDWNRLAEDIPFRSADWLATWWSYYQQPATELCVLTVETEAGELIGLAPWYIETTATRGRVIQFLGSGEVCSDYVTILSAPKREDEVAGAICKWLSDEAAKAWDLIKLIDAEANDPAISALTKQFAARQHQIHECSGMNCWSVALPATWDEFLATINSSRRAKIRKALRQYFDNHEVVTHLLTDPADLERRFATLKDLHQRRQEALGHAGCFSSAQFTEFHREVSRRFLAQGKLRLTWTEMAGRPIAADYSFLGGRTVYYYQTGLEPDVIKVAPGWLGMIGSIKLAIESGFRTFDFLRGDEAYKMSWGAQPRPTIETRIVARRASASLRHAAWLARTNLRHWLKKGFHFGRKVASDTE
jgi:CelD/BcsL family acetyltransferase involved in cellulose biosynthesis